MSQTEPPIREILEKFRKQCINKSGGIGFEQTVAELEAHQDKAVKLEKAHAYSRGLSTAGFLYIQYPHELAQEKLLNKCQKADEMYREALKPFQARTELAQQRVEDSKQSPRHSDNAPEEANNTGGEADA